MFAEVSDRGCLDFLLMSIISLLSQRMLADKHCEKKGLKPSAKRQKLRLAIHSFSVSDLNSLLHTKSMNPGKSKSESEISDCFVQVHRKTVVLTWLNVPFQVTTIFQNELIL